MTAKTRFRTNIIKRYKNGESSYQISKNEGCSYNAVLRELKRRQVNTGAKFWTKKEIKKLKEFYSIMSKKGLLKEFPNRSQQSIATMAVNLGLKKKERKKTCESCGKEFITKQQQNFCLKCIKKQWEFSNPKNAKERQKQWLQKNPEYIKKYMKIPQNRERIRQYFRQYVKIPQNRERVRRYHRQYFKQLRKESPKFRLNDNIRVAIYKALKGKKAGRHWENLVDYTLQDLIKHLEIRFDNRMNWQNYGSYWSIDHIKPKSLFNYSLTEDKEFKKCWSLKNLQPLEKIANLRKSNTFAL